MIKERESVATRECNGWSAEHAKDSGLSVLSVTVVPSRKVVQVTDDNVEHVVVTSEGKGTILIRGRKDRDPDECPFLNCQIRYIAAHDDHNQKLDSACASGRIEAAKERSG